MKILILGAGALGSNIAKLLAVDLRERHEITVLDYDKVEERNVQAGTQFYFREQKGLPKVQALQYNIYKQYGRKISVVQGKIKNFFPSYADLIVDCFDNFDARNYIQEKWKILNCPNLVHVGFSPQFTFAIEWAENYVVPEDDKSGFDICEAEGAASFISMVSSLASLVVQEYVFEGKKKEFMGSRFTITEIK